MNRNVTPPPKSYHHYTSRIAQERKRRPLIRRAVRYGSLLAVLFTLALLYFVWHAGYVYAAWRSAIFWFNSVTASSGVRLEHIYINGLKELTVEDVIAVIPGTLEPPYNNASMEDLSTLPLYSISPDRLRARLEEMGWIKRAQVERQLPSTLHIMVKERTPRAIWQIEGAVHLVDGEGAVISYNSIGRFTELPIIVGSDALSEVESLMKFVEAVPRIQPLVESFIFISNRRWDIQLKNGIRIKLPEENPGPAWRYIAKLDEQKQILDRAIAAIDIRDPSRLYIELLGGAQEMMKGEEEKIKED